MHPEIPSELSQKAKNFILRCFIPDPEKRATAAVLLEDPFLCELVYIFKDLFLNYFRFSLVILLVL